MHTSPLRYPGGKTFLSGFFEELIRVNSLNKPTYVEPYAGGAGAAINLLLNNRVDSIIINDASISLFSFWHYLLESSERFLDIFDKTDVTLMEWRRQSEILKISREPSLKLGFATFYLSRCNRSGILNAGPIGGKNEEDQEKSKYKIDCRFNKISLFKKLSKIIERKQQISVFNEDALFFLKSRQSRFSGNTFIYLDPPYYKHGTRLYLDYYKHCDHASLADFLKSSLVYNWVLSYDNVDQTRKLYDGFKQYKFSMNYSAQKIRKGSELFIHSPKLVLPNPLEIKRPSGNIQLIAIN